MTSADDSASEFRYRTYAWPAISSRFAEFKDTQLDPMRQFIEQVSASTYSTALYPCPSMDRLLIGRVPDFSCLEPHLRVWYNSVSRQFYFSYVKNPAGNQMWETRAPIAKAFSHFEHLLLRRLRWFHKPSRSGEV